MKPNMKQITQKNEINLSQKFVKYFVVLLFINISIFLSGQSIQLSNAKETLSKSTSDKEKLDAASYLSKYYEEVNIDSSLYFSRQVFSITRLTGSAIELGNISLGIGDIFIKQNELDSAETYYMISRESLNNSDSLYNYVKSSIRLGNIYLAQNDYIQSLKLYQECLTICQEEEFDDLTPHLFNNLGLLYKEIEDYKDATDNFQTAFEMFKKNGDEVNSVYPLYNIALIQSITGNDQEAIDGYLALTSYHLKTENWLSVAYIYNSISEIYFRNEDYDLAEKYLQMALNAIEEKSDSFNSGPTSLYKSAIYSNAAELYFMNESDELAKKYARMGYKISTENSYVLNLLKSTKILGDLYEKEGKIDSSLLYLKRYIASNEMYQNEYDVKQLTRLKMQNEFDEILKNKELERIFKEASYKNRELRFIAIAVLATLIAIILILLYTIQKSKTTKLKLKEENFLLEKRKLNQDLDHKKKELVSKLLYLLEKNEFITSISKKLIELKPDAKKDNRNIIQKIINEIRQNSSQQVWDEFELRFTEVHSEFYKKLHELHPDLTPNEVKLCAFLRLNMSTKEISAITHQSIKSINMARFRLRKKLNMSRDENLISHLNGIL